MLVEPALECRSRLARDRERPTALVRDMRRARVDARLGRRGVEGPFPARRRGVRVARPVDCPYAKVVGAVVEPGIGLRRGARGVATVIELALEGRVFLARGELEPGIAGERVRRLGELRRRRLRVDLPLAQRRRRIGVSRAVDRTDAERMLSLGEPRVRLR